ncbi:conserved hypothetical protein [Cupriavidus taiwanensis]|uniref:hypothetical protein n=1 Tax=Cupriavidus taiwanensis TaxID=164546 RepID=UPI000E17E377|nr:hypothetical protein [Cupriavidus taiwanensis]SOZ24673.1 conserved hypothetical protein [Cupriavidus taiwanensis]
MVGKRKVFKKTELSIPVVKYEIIEDSIAIPPEAIPPENMLITFPKGASYRTFDFFGWYGVGIDTITYACQRQIERFLAKQDNEVEVQTVISYCQSGLHHFLEYLAVLSAALQRDLILNDINRDVIDGYILFLKSENIATITKKNRYNATKPVLKALCQRRLINEVLGGDEATFPPNPFPDSHKGKTGEEPLPLAQRNAVAYALRVAVRPLLDNTVAPTSELLAYAYLIIALHTGANATPLLEIDSNSLRPHPKSNTSFLVLHKRRGHSTRGVAVNDPATDDTVIESFPTLRPGVATLVRRVIELSSLLRDEAPSHLRACVWLYRSRQKTKHVEVGEVCALSKRTLQRAIGILIQRFELKDADGRPLRLNVGRLRKTFINRMYEILDGDVVSTAAAAGNTPTVADVSYLRPGEEAERNWRFLGIALTNELLTDTLGATERTPVGGCSDIRNGQYAPKTNNTICTNFLNCIRCKNYVVTGDDLHRLFSFYWRIYSERERMNPRRWRQSYAHIVRVIDRDIIEVGITNGIFQEKTVMEVRELSRKNPHPFWGGETIIKTIQEMSK